MCCVSLNDNQIATLKVLPFEMGHCSLRSHKNTTPDPRRTSKHRQSRISPFTPLCRISDDYSRLQNAGWAYGVAATFLPHKGGAVPESEKRRAAWCTTSTSHTYFRSASFSLGLFHLPISFQLRRGGGGRGCGVRCGVSVCVSCGYSKCPSVCIIINR